MRVRLYSLLTIAAATAVTLSAGQSQTPTFRTRTELVQVDVVVDREGNHVRGLGAEDFELFDRDKAQRVVAFDEVSRVRDEAGKPQAADRRAERANIAILDAEGKTVFSQDVDSNAGRVDSTFTLPSGLPRGAYLLRLATGGTVNHETGILVR